MTEDIYEELKDIWAIDTHNHVGNAFVSIDGFRSITKRISRNLVDPLIDMCAWHG